MTPSAQAQIVQYIEQNRSIYTSEAITQQLIRAGYTADDIAAAWRTVESWGAEGARFSGGPPAGALAAGVPDSAPGIAEAPPRQRVFSSPMFWLTMVGFILLAYLVPAIPLYLSTLSTNSGDSTSALSSLSLLLFLVIAGAGLIGGLVLLNRNRAVAYGLIVGLFMAACVLPFLAVVIFFGICVYALNYHP